jgi:PEP-CTERM motif
VSNYAADAADYQFLHSRFGAMVETPPGVASMVSSVPEPSTLFLVVIGALAALSRRSRLHAY